MTRLSTFSSPLLLGFDHLERLAEQVAKAAGDGYPPYNIERIGEDGLRITLAVAGFAAEELSVSVENSQLIIRASKAEDDSARVYLHRGIASRQFQRRFVLAEGIEVIGARLDNGLLHVDLKRRSPDRLPRTISIEKAPPSGKSPATGRCGTDRSPQA